MDEMTIEDSRSCNLILKREISKLYHLDETQEFLEESLLCSRLARFIIDQFEASDDEFQVLEAKSKAEQTSLNSTRNLYRSVRRLQAEIIDTIAGLLRLQSLVLSAYSDVYQHVANKVRSLRDDQ